MKEQGKKYKTIKLIHHIFFLLLFTLMDMDSHFWVWISEKIIAFMSYQIKSINELYLSALSPRIPQAHRQTEQ